MTNKVTITISGDVGCGKTLILAKIAKMLKEEFNAIVNDNVLNYECPVDINNVAQWEKDSVTNTEWILREEIKNSESKKREV